MELMGKREQIINEAESLLSKDVLGELKDWYEYTLEDEWRFVIFAVRRSYMMALIFECITEKKMSDSSAEFLTDAALFLRCGELADMYRKYGAFPRILLCDDIMIHGRNMNHIIEGLQKELCRLLADEFERSEIEAALVRAVRIHVYTRTWNHLLLIGSYGRRLHYMRKESPNFWHQLSSDISSLIFRSDITNACYIYTEHLSDAMMDRIQDKLINEDGFIKTVYQKIEQYAKFTYLDSADRISGVLSLRIIKNDYHEGYRVAPFVFLPNMDTRETEKIFDIISEKLPEKYRDWFAGLKEMTGKRTFNEFITLLFSDAVLKKFNQDNEITVDSEDREWELEKLARNYNQYGFEQTRQMLEELLGNSQKSILSMEDIDKVIGMLSSIGKIVMKLKTTGDAELDATEKHEIRERVENYFYMQGLGDERSAHQLVEAPYFPTKLRSKRHVENCCFVLAFLNQGYTKEQSRYCMSYFLHMIDAGVGSLSSYAPNDTDVNGYAQFAKAGEQSLLIEPLRKYKYIPLLSRMQFECGHRLRELTDEIGEYGAEIGWDQSLIDTLTQFVIRLAKIGQTPWDWDGNYIRKVDGAILDIIDLMDEQNSLRETYVNHVKEKNKNRRSR